MPFEEHAVRPVASVITPTYNRRDSLLRTLDALARQTVDFADFEVLVISDGSSDGTAEAVAALDVPYTLRYFEQDHEGPAAARARGVREARGSLIVFVDDDMVPAPEWMAEHLALHQREPHAVGIGPLLIPPDARLQPWVWWEGAMLVKQYDDMIAGKWAPSYRQFYTGNGSVPRQDILDAGGFDATFRRAEDIELAMRLRDHGSTFHFLPSARGWHYARRSFASWYDIPYAYAQADLAMAARPGHQVILETMGEEFYYRHTLLMQLARLCVGRPWLCALVVQAAGVLGRVAGAFPGKIARKAMSGMFSIVFNLRYYEGMADGLGPSKFWAIVARNAPDHRPTTADDLPAPQPAEEASAQG